jgi:hypothetical protein
MFGFIALGVMHDGQQDKNNRGKCSGICRCAGARPTIGRESPNKNHEKRHRRKAQDVGPSIIGFGTQHYKYESGREGDTMVVGFSPRKPATVMNGLIGLKDAAALLAKLGKHSTGKGCLYIKNLSDVDQKVLDDLIVKSVAARRAS